MTIITTANSIFVQTISNIISNLPWFILFIWGFKIVAKEIEKAVKQIPNWLEQYEQIIKQKRAIDNALSRR